MTVLCLVERDAGAAADVSLRALTFARSLAASTASAAPSAPPSPAAAAQRAGELPSVGAAVDSVTRRYHRLLRSAD